MPILGIVASSISGNLWPASSYESIATATGDGSSNTITFSSIPSTYTSLQIRGIANDTGANNIGLRFNGDSGNNYTTHNLQGYGTGAQALSFSSISRIWGIGWATSVANTNGATIIDVLDYASSTKNKVAKSFMGFETNGSGNAWLTSGIWVNTNAITSITIVDLGGVNFETGTQFALYGIK